MAAKLQEFFQWYPDVAFVRWIYMDLAGIPRVNVLPKRYSLVAAEKGSILSSGSPSVALGTFEDGIMFENLEPGIDILIPDWNSLKLCTFCPTHAMVMCAVHQPLGDRTGLEEDDRTGETPSIGDEGFDSCARVLLARQVARANKAGQTILIGLEIELLLYKPGTVQFGGNPGQIASYNTTNLWNLEHTRVMDEMITCLEGAGIAVMMYGMEPGVRVTFEITLAPLPPMQAADAMVFCRETMKTIAHKNGYEATLIPVPFEKASSTLGAHTNISISDPGSDNKKGESFLSGILESACGLSAINSPSARLSAQRVIDFPLIKYVRWGHDNKAALVRQRRRGLWELRNPDGTMNPYLAFAALIAAGMNGLESNKPLEMKPLPCSFETAFHMTDEQKEEFGVREEMPTSLAAALDCLNKDKALVASLGEKVVKMYTKVKETEIKSANNLTLGELKERLMVVF